MSVVSLIFPHGPWTSMNSWALRWTLCVPGCGAPMTAELDRLLLMRPWRSAGNFQDISIPQHHDISWSIDIHRYPCSSMFRVHDLHTSSIHLPYIFHISSMSSQHLDERICRDNSHWLHGFRYGPARSMPFSRASETLLQTLEDRGKIGCHMEVISLTLRVRKWTSKSSNPVKI